MRYMKNDPYLNQCARVSYSKREENTNNSEKKSYSSVSSTSSSNKLCSSSSPCQNNRLFAFLRRGDWSAAFERCQSHPQEAHHTNVDPMGNTALHLAFQCIGTSSGGALPPLHLIQALLLADEESASIVVKAKNTSSSSSSFSYLPLSYTPSSSWKNESKKESKRNRGTTPLHLAVLHKTSPIILSLLLSANPLATDTLDELGRTPLHRACGSIAIGGGDVGSITGDFNEHYYTNYNHTAATAVHHSTTLLPPVILLNHMG
mmetsp:Transcript_34829/g.51054  ORF Transcript_34829/g.51054 Transcript_34829/m.51054 type:complete len:261 (+) Transcript_34829:91-873(+)